MSTKDQLVELNTLLIDIVKNELDKDVMCLLKRRINEYYTNNHVGMIKAHIETIQPTRVLHIDILDKKEYKDKIMKCIKHEGYYYFYKRIMFYLSDIHLKCIDSELCKKMGKIHL